MRKLVVTKKTGFKVTIPNIPVIIRDFRGVIFYTTEPLLPSVKKFNLPKGVYFVDSGYFTPMERPRKYKILPLPPPQRNYPKPFKFKVLFGNNPNKCSIIWDLKTILFDRQFLEKPKFVLDFILFHEFGHALYLSEHLADRLSANYMFIRGYNPSQIGTAPFISLSERQIGRKKFMVNGLIKK